MRPSDSDYYRRGKTPKPAWPAQDPPPEVTTRDPRPEGIAGEPSAVRTLQRALQGAGWAIRVGYARGPERAVRIGQYKMTESWGVYADAHPSTGWRLSAVYGRTVGGKTGWQWRSIALWRPGRVVAPGLGVRFTHALRSDLGGWIGLAGAVSPAWFKEIHAREEDKAEQARKRARSASKTAKEGSS